MKFVEMNETEQEQFLNEHLDRSTISDKQELGEDTADEEERVPKPGKDISRSSFGCTLTLIPALKSVPQFCDPRSQP